VARASAQGEAAAGAYALMPGKIIKFEKLQLLEALEQLAKDKSGTFQEIADEAFTDLLKQYKRPTTLLGALKESVKHLEVSSP
jgi:hypothetical protein